VVLGLGLASLVATATQLSVGSTWQDVAVAAFAGALLAAALAVIFLGLAVFPRAPKPQTGRSSLLYYRSVAAMSEHEYEARIERIGASCMNHHRAVEAYELARIAQAKAKWTGCAFICAGIFLVLWPTARIVLAFTS
jgi:hypothetical protein